VLCFGLIATVMTLILAHVLVPASRTALAKRSVEISQNVTARFLNDGQFMHPAPGITLYIRELTQTGELRDVFLADDRSASTRALYTAKRALLVRDATGDAPALKLVMIDGMVQTLARANNRMVVTRFADVTYDIGALLVGSSRNNRNLQELSTAELLSATPALMAETGQGRAAFLFEGHSRFSEPFMATAAALIGFAALLLGSFSRFGLWRQILLAVLALIGLQLINTSVTGIALQDARAWPLAYAAPGIGIVASLGLLWLAQRPRRLPRDTLAEAAA
ncbi:MAG: LptF/LptG family permease, partial [Paracoccaceae bacterium]|nr:LptF/LptG family permease [Paracoccaceae bacterium]